MSEILLCPLPSRPCVDLRARFASGFKVSGSRAVRKPADRRGGRGLVPKMRIACGMVPAAALASGGALR